MEPVQKIRRLIGIAFLVLLILLPIGTLVGVSYVTLVHRNLNTIVKDYNVKNNLAHQLRRALQERRLSLHDFIWQESTAGRDEAWHHFKNAASEYLLLRGRLLSMPMDKDIAQAMNTLDSLNEQTQVSQLAVAELIYRGKRREALELVKETQTKQNQVDRQVDRLVRLHEQLNANAVTDAENAYKRMKYMLIPIGATAILLGVLIAWQISRNIRYIMEDMTRQQDKYKTLFESNFDAVMLWHKEHLEDCNQTARRMFQVESLEAFQAMHFLDLLPETQENGESSEKLLERRIAEAMAHSSSYFEWQQRRMDGSLFPAEVAMTQVCLQGRPMLQIVIRDITERKEAEQRIEYLAYYDALSGLPNSVLFKERLNLCLANARREQRKFTVMLLDLDRFKMVNASLGHHAGDELLKRVAMRLSDFLPSGDTVGRMGGDNFMLMLSDVDRISKAIQFAEECLTLLSRPFTIADQELSVSASIGIVLYPHDGITAELLLKHADTAMYRAKAAGGNNYRLFTDEMNLTAYRRMKLESFMLRGIEKEEFRLYYQPKINVSDASLVGMEALIRWEHPHLGLLGPAEFIPIAEESGLILPLSEWIINTACRQTKSWHEEGFPLHVSINLSVRQFQCDSLLPYIRRVLETTELNPAHVEFEITESATLHAEAQAIEILNAFKEIGVRISIDDFGTGYSSLGYLKKYPLDVLKIDKSFTEGLPDNQGNAAITAAIIRLAHSLSCQVVAEGVETREQLLFLHQHGCDTVQGYYFGRPMSTEDFDDFIRSYQGFVLEEPKGAA